MILGIWRAQRNPSRSLEDYVKFQEDVLVQKIKSVRGCLGVLNFHSENEWGTIQLWESREADLAADTSPEAKFIYEQLMASGLLVKEGTYEWFEVHNGFVLTDAIEKHIK